MTALIYLDHNATTPLDPVVLEQMLPWMTDNYWNASSSHSGGRRAAAAVEAARSDVAQLIEARAGELVWTSGATEANNLALKGLFDEDGARRRMVTVATEHKAVLDTANWLATRGIDVDVLAIEPDGSLDLDRIDDALADDDVALVSVMAANNETGVITDLGPIVERAHAHGALVHTDATQIVGKLPFSVAATGVDLASLSAHKMYGPKGIGALYVARGVQLAPLLHGGGHERGLRSGTLNVPGIVGLGAAAALADVTVPAEAGRQAALRTDLLSQIAGLIPDTHDNTATASQVLPNTLSVRFIGAEADAVIVNAPEVAMSSGSACTALTPEPSHVLLAMGLDRTAATECLRLSLGRGSTQEDVVRAAQSLQAAVSRVRELSEW